MVLGIFVKSEKIWDILKIENLEYANANLSERVQVLEIIIPIISAIKYLLYFFKCTFKSLWKIGNRDIDKDYIIALFLISLHSI